MNHHDCEPIRDLLPALVRGEMPPQEAAAAIHHLRRCPECTDEAEIVRLLQGELAPVPGGLEARVVAAVRAHGVRRRAPARLAMAATLAAAIIGGAVAYDRLLAPETAPGAVDVSSLSWAAAEDVLLHGGSGLDELSVDELEHLLQELE